MGSENSKAAKKAEPSAAKKEEEGTKFQYGPPPQRTSQIQGQTNATANNSQYVRNSSVSQPKQSTQMQSGVYPSPPPYSPVDPLGGAYNVNSKSLNHLPPVPPRRVVSSELPRKQCIICRTIGSHDTADCLNQPPPIPPLPVVNKNPKIPSPSYEPDQNPFVWTNKSQETSSSKKSTPSPTYNPTDNPFVWSKKKQSIITPPKKDRVVIDLEDEIPKIQKHIKENNQPSFLHFNKELNKNKSLAEIRKGMVSNKYLSDVKFMLGGSVIHGHKMFLTTASFLFYDHFHDKGETEMLIDGIDFETFFEVLTYCYTDKLSVNENNVQELLTAGTKLQVRQITNVCHGFISNLMNPISIFIILGKALEVKNEFISKKCLDFINKNEEKCFSSTGFFEMSLASLMKILEVCKYSSQKAQEIIEKWNHGAIGISEQAANIPQVENNPSGAVKKQPAKKKPKQKQPKPPASQPNIPNLMSLNIPGPQMVPPFPFPPPNLPPYIAQPIRPFADPPQEKLITYDDENDDCSSVISHDDEAKQKVGVVGKRHKSQTEFSRLDFVCKRSMLVHEIWFSENLAAKSQELKLTVCVFEQNKRDDVHVRVLKNNKPGMKMNFVRFNRSPLKLYIGQKFFVKLNFNESAERLNIHSNGLTPNDFLELRNDSETKKYFNCISSLLVSEMP